MARDAGRLVHLTGIAHEDIAQLLVERVNRIEFAVAPEEEGCGVKLVRARLGGDDELAAGRARELG